MCASNHLGAFQPRRIESSCYCKGFMICVNVTVPVFNEEAQLEESVVTLERFLSQRRDFESRIVIANNGSTDRTWQIAEALCQRFTAVSAINLEENGRGRALKTIWTDSTAEVLSYMDVDLSTDLEAFPNLIGPLINGSFDLATGSRLRAGSQTTRGLKREFVSRCYNSLVKICFRTSFSDAQCGFKAITRDAAKALLPLINDTGWFFDTELLVVAEKLGYRIFDLPVHWIDDSDSRVKILPTAWENIKGLFRVRKKLLLFSSDPPLNEQVIRNLRLRE